MRIIKQSQRKQPRLSMVLLDWGVRESFHLFHYLNNQTVPRDAFEVILIEYYNTVSEPAGKFDSQIDTWILLEMPDDCYYHKHLMYNVGVGFSQGQIVMFGDSDAMVRPTFVETILKAFDRDPSIVYHMDEFRNIRRDFYPFNYPSFEDVLGDGCINNVGNKTKGILDKYDPMHSRNFGACMCALRDDVIAIGGADEDLSYLGHICGPYDMTFRLMNAGRRMVWETEEYLYHTWHPGTDGINNYLGPHDGRHMSTTAFQALCSGRIPPVIENEAIRRLRMESQPGGAIELANCLIDPTYAKAFNRSALSNPLTLPPTFGGDPESIFAYYRGFYVYCIDGLFYAFPRHLSPQTPSWGEDEHVIGGRSFSEVRDKIDSTEAHFLETVGECNLYRLGQRVAVIPHGLAVDLWLREHREHPAIVYTEGLKEAREAAQRMRALVPVSVDPIPAEMPTPDQQAPMAVELSSDLTQVTSDMANLERRLAAVESDVSGIYRSRTWRALTRFGGILQGAGKTVRPRRNGSN